MVRTFVLRVKALGLMSLGILTMLFCHEAREQREFKKQENQNVSILFE